MNPLPPIDELIKKLGFSHYGYSATTKPLGWNHYFEWIEKNYHGEMDYLKKHLEIKRDLKNIQKTVNSIISLAHPYRALTESADFTFKNLKVALYAQDVDYHFWLKEKLEEIVAELKKNNPDDFFLATTDSFPILERDFAYQNRLGWIGKNSCLIHPKEGSLFLLGNIVTSLDLSSQHGLDPLPDFCGTCTRCIDQCPTSAIHSDRTLDAKKCISYWTIEAKNSPPLDLAKKFQGHFFGCDICQSVCPWNQKVFTRSNNYSNSKMDEDSINRDQVEELRFILTSSGKQLLKRLKNTPLIRSGQKGLKRNALVVIANLKIKELKSEVENFLDHPALAKIAKWTLDELESKN